MAIEPWGDDETERQAHFVNCDYRRLDERELRVWKSIGNYSWSFNDGTCVGMHDVDERLRKQLREILAKHGLHLAGKGGAVMAQTSTSVGSGAQRRRMEREKVPDAVAEITTALEVLCEPGAWHELRTLNGRGTTSGYFCDNV